MNNYIATISFRVNADDDAGAYKRVNRFISKMDMKLDNNPLLISLEERVSGMLVSREIDFGNLKADLSARNKIKEIEILSEVEK